MIKVKNISRSLDGGVSGKLADTIITTGPKDPIARKDAYNDKLSLDELQAALGNAAALEGREEIDEELIKKQTILKEIEATERPTVTAPNTTVGAGPRVPQYIDIIESVESSGGLRQIIETSAYVESVGRYGGLTTEERMFHDRRRLSDALGGESILRTLPDDKRLDLIKQIGDATTNGGSILLNSPDGNVLLPATKILDALSMAELSENTSVIDLSAMGVATMLKLDMALINNSLNSAVQALDLVKDFTAYSDIKNALADAANTAAESSNLPILGEIVKVGGREAIVNRFPIIDRTILENVSIGQTGDDNDVFSWYDLLIDILDTLKPGWDYGVRNALDQHVLSPYINATDDALKILAINERHYPDILFARAFKQTDAYTIAQRFNPATILMRR